jgi:hypothetical protein
MPKIYAGALYAESFRKYQLAAATIVANSWDEAKASGFEAARMKWPAADGWAHHDCSVVEISSEQLTQLTAIDGETARIFTGRAVTSGDVVGDVVFRLSQTDPSKVQEVAASQVELLTIYHNVVLDQARRSFRWALIAAMIGLGFFLAAVAFLLLQQPQNLATVSLISGALIEIISGINFYLYGKTSAQLAEFQTRLDQTQRFLLANSVCEGLEGDYKQQTRAQLVGEIASASRRLSDQSHSGKTDSS